MPQSRAAGHYLCSELVRVSFRTVRGETRHVVGNLEEICAERAVVLLDAPVSPQTNLWLGARGRRFGAVVESCVHDPLLGYLLSLRFAGRYRWNPADFEPAHMLRVRDASPTAKAAAYCGTACRRARLGTEPRP
jgi:hypothetical protein